MADLGYLSLIMALSVTIYALVAQLAGIKTGDGRLQESARGGILAASFLVTFASVLLIYFLVTSDFTIRYVYEYTSRSLPAFYKFSAFWAGNAGSLLLWAWILSIYSVIVAFSKRGDQDRSLPYVNIILLLNVFFFLLVLNFLANPFERMPVVVRDGHGLNPQLQNPGMVFHPLTVYLGYVGFAVPYAFALAALITKRVGDQWIKTTRRWSVIAWMFLSLGNLTGAQWAYVELGWGGFWAWDPVENASFVPWLTATAFIHSVMIQERKDLLKIWNMVLIMITYLLTLFGTYLVRSGVIVSVHAFGTSQLGHFFLGFLILMVIISAYFLISRLGLLREEKELESYLSRESSFLINNLLLVGAAFAVFWGTIFPLVSDLIRGVKITVGPPFFNQVAGPILLAILFLMGICPLIAWQRSSWKNLRDNFLWPFLAALVFGIFLYLVGIRMIYPIIGFIVAFFVLITIIKEFSLGTRVRSRLTGETVPTAFWGLVSRNRRRYGGYLVHLGVVLIAIAITGTMGLKNETVQTVTRGEHIHIGDYQLTFQGLEQKPRGQNVVVFADMPVIKNGKIIGRVMPEKVFYDKWDQPSTEVSILGSLKEDLYVILSTWDKGGEEVTFKVNVNPLMAWMWIGGYILIFGTVFALWPGTGRRVGPKYTPR